MNVLFRVIRRQNDTKCIDKGVSMIKLMVAIVLLIGILSAWSPAQGKLSREAEWVFSITDKITSEDVLQVRNALQTIKPETKPLSVRPLFYLNSPGGDIYAAMEMGRLLRKARAICIVPVHKQCASACVFVLSGGIERSVYGKIAIHRPYSTYVGLRDYESAEKQYRKTEIAAKDYLKEMNLPDKLYEAMVQIPPEQIRVLSRKEIEGFSLAGIDPVEQELRDSVLAGRFGISKREYLSRKIRVESVCPPHSHKPSDQEIDDSIACNEAFMYGLQVDVYKARKPRADQLCSAYNNDLRQLWSCTQAVLRGEK